ncbi:MAG: hypothetical protein KA831_00215 [Pyrinomonadaceae bacterium]|nr:hypothetical protein [Pyrinomonadaceae bacterium]
MRSFAIIFLFSVLLIPAFTQTTKPKQTASKTAAAKPKTTPKKPSAAASKPKVTATPKPKVDETAEWEKATATADAFERVGAIKKFLSKFPRSTRQSEGLEMMLRLRADIGNQRILAGDLENAAKLFKAGAAEAPKPVADQLFTETLAKFPANLFFRGSQEDALDIAKTIEERIETNPTQLITIANFYLSVENGAEAKRVAENVIKIVPDSSAAYQTLGLANRLEFKLEDSAAAYAKALELDAGSVSARRGLAEMKRSLGKADEAVVLYREILTRDPANAPARAGLILSLFDTGKRADAEAELKTSLDANAGNVILLAGAAYWYAANGIGEKAVEYGQKAITADPRYIWSHIAVARGLLLEDKPLEAEKTLLAARKYGNFPTIEYEIATMRAAAGLYREAAESLSKMFVMKDGQVATDLGLRVPVQADSFIKLIEDERRASTFAPMAADTQENALRLRSLFEFMNAVNGSEADAAAKLADAFVDGSDRMKTYRQLFASSQLLAKKLAPAKVAELAKAAVPGVETALDFRHATSAILADEIYQPRTLAEARNEYIQVANVSRATLSAILRGRIEELAGAALFQMDNTAESIIRYRRAVGVLPGDSVWWRSTMWRLATAYEASGNTAEALDAYYKSYKAGTPDPIKYAVIESLYRRTNGNTEGLELKIGRNPLRLLPDEGVAQNTTPTSTPEATPQPTPEPGPTIPATVPVKIEPTPESTPTVSASPSPTPKASPELTPEPAADVVQTPTPTPTPEPTATPSPKTTNLFPPVVITIPAANSAMAKTIVDQPKPTASPTPGETTAAVKTQDERPAVKPCSFTASEPSITLQKAGSELAIIIGTETDEDLTDLTFVSSDPDEIGVRREEISAVKGRALFIVRTISGKAGLYQITFSLPCGKQEVEVRVR